LVIAAAAYVLFAGTFAALLLFMHDYFSPSWGAGVDVCSHSLLNHLAVDGGLIVFFGLQHSIMARRSFKQRWTRIVPLHLERTAYVIASSAALIVMMAYWRPLPTVVWESRSALVWWLSVAVGVIGVVIVLWSTFLTDHFELFGLRQAYLHGRGIAWTPVPFKQAALYNFVRHPMMLGMLILLWVTPRMTLGHLVLAVGFTLYVIIGVHFEEKDLKRELGPAYERYRNSTPMLFPRLWRRAPGGASQSS
jgi:protein-S-isoprenylcysteine O-methyltransferase Ste14